MAEPEAYRFADDGAIPNSRLPLLVYRAAVPADPAAIERLFATHLWPPAWRDGVYPFHHFHSRAHEVLGIARGTARVRFGGPDGQAIALGPGDVVVIPAGVGHCAEQASPDLLVVGAYPADAAEAGLCRGRRAEHAEVIGLIAAVPLPEADPVAGREGPLKRLWSGADTD